MKTLTAFALMIRKHMDALNIEPHQVSVFMESGEVKAGGGKQAEQGQHLGDFEYRIALTIDALPAVNGGIILAALQAFSGNLDRRDLSDLQIEVTAVSDRLIDLDASLQVRDALYIQQDEQGPIKTHSGNYSFKSNPFDVAEQLDEILSHVKD